MTIDEVIAQELNIAKNRRKNFDECNERKNNYSCRLCVETQTCLDCAEEHEQIAEWLEELKEIKEMDLSIPQHFTKEQSAWIKAYCIQRNKEFYNKAIDEAICKVEKHRTNGYVTGISNNPFEFGACQMADDIVKILKQLKAGAKDD